MKTLITFELVGNDLTLFQLAQTIENRMKSNHVWGGPEPTLTDTTVQIAPTDLGEARYILNVLTKSIAKTKFAKSIKISLEVTF